MKKKVLSVLLCAALMAGSLAACGDKDEESGSGSESSQSSESAQPEDGSDAQDGAGEESTDGAGDTVEVMPEALPDAFAHYTFDGDEEGYTAIKQDTKAEDSKNDGGTYDLVETAVNYHFADGPVGKALYLDGTFGLDLNLEPTNTDAYTVSFWVNAKYFFQFGATLQIGYNIGRAADAGNNVTWLNVTETNFGAENGLIYPCMWSRNEASDAQDGTDCWPWMYAWDDAIHGKQEWVMVTVVCSGEKQDSPLGTTTAGAQYYLNGQKMYDSWDNYTNHTYWEDYTWDATLAPNIMKPGNSEFESYFGINYWDPMFVGYVDDLYVYNTALTAGQVLTLYQMGDANVAMEYPDAAASVAEEPAEPTAFTHDDVEITGTQLGATDCSTAFWTEFSEVVEIPEGETVKANFKNYTSGLNNWNNFVVILQNVADAHSADDNAEYAEYAVVRADNFGWGAGYDNIATPACDWNWDTFAADLDGADVELSITNNGDTADVVAVVTTASGSEYTQSYKGIVVTGDLYYCLTVDGSFIDIQ